MRDIPENALDDPRYNLSFIEPVNQPESIRCDCIDLGSANAPFICGPKTS